MNSKHFTISLFIFALSCLGLNLNAQCIEGSHSPFEEDAWLSCDKGDSPVETLNDKHWIQYDFDHIYYLDSLEIWNYNVWGSTDSGIKRFELWSSLNGLDWMRYGSEFELSKAPGSWRYNTPDGITLDALAAKHLLIVSLETFDALGSCAGLSEVKIYANETTSTEELSSLIASDIILGPNPASDMLNISFINDYRADNIQVYNSLGALVKVFNEVSYPSSRIDISTLNDGLYTLLFQSDNGYIQKQLVKLSR